MEEETLKEIESITAEIKTLCYRLDEIQTGKLHNVIDYESDVIWCACRAIDSVVKGQIEDAQMYARGVDRLNKGAVESIESYSI